MVETKVETVQVNAVTFWPCTYKRVTEEDVIIDKEWEDSFMLSLHSSHKILKPEKTKHAPANDTVKQSVQAWSLRCDPC